MAASKSKKIQAEIDKVKAKISEQQARLKELEQKHRSAGGHLISCSMGVRKKLQNIQSLISAFQTCQHI